MELSDLRSTMPGIIQGIALQDSNKCLFLIVKPAGMTCGFLLTGAGDLCYNLRSNEGRNRQMNTRDTLKVNSAGHLEIGGADCVDLAREFGTPLYVFDEAYIRNMMRLYRDTIAEEYGGNGLVLYASKAFSCKAMYAIAKQERIGVDVGSGGELYTALSAGFPAEKS